MLEWNFFIHAPIQQTTTKHWEGLSELKSGPNRNYWWKIQWSPPPYLHVLVYHAGFYIAKYGSFEMTANFSTEGGKLVLLDFSNLEKSNFFC
jgi:hypothetical protein